MNSDDFQSESSEYSFRFAQTYSSRFLSWMNKQLAQEGGFYAWPENRGGDTNKGIVQTEYDEFRKKYGLKTQSVKYITDAEIKKIYYENYWLKMRLENMKPSIAYITGAMGLLRNAYIAAISLNKIIQDKIKSQPIRNSVSDITLKNLKNLTNNFENEKEIALALLKDLEKVMLPQIAKGLAGYGPRLASMKKDLLELLNASNLNNFFEKMNKVSGDLTFMIDRFEKILQKPSSITNASFMSGNDQKDPLKLPPSSLSLFK